MPEELSTGGERLELSTEAMAQLYRGELGRSDRWRTRLDTTTNWALATTAAAIVFAFSTPSSSHLVILLGLWMVVIFLLVEARRYRYYDLWIRRVRLFEDGFWAPMLRREPVDPDAMKELALEMSRPQIQLSLFSALGTRMNRTYGPILILLFLSWYVKLFSHPSSPESWTEFVSRAKVGPVPGSPVMALVCALFLVCGMLALASVLARPPLGELQARRRSKKKVLWEMLARPYEIKQPRRQGPVRATPKIQTH